MDVMKFSYSEKTGWVGGEFPKWDSPQTVLFVFCAPEFMDAPQALQELARRYPTSKIVGCSSAGEIFGTGVHDRSISVAVVRFADTHLRLEAFKVADTPESFALAVKAATKMNAPDLAAVFVLSDGLAINGSLLVSGLSSILPKKVVVTGGLAADGDRFKRTWVLVNGEPKEGYVTVLGFYGSRVRVHHGSQGGWDIFGPERVITRSEGNVLFELDGKPALDLYKKYLGEKADGLPATALLFPLQIRLPNEKRTIVRTILSVDHEKKTMTFAGDLPQGSLAQLMRANFDRLIDGASEAAEKVNPTPGVPTLVVAISCVGRRLVLGERVEEETEAIREKFGDEAKHVGFYSYGEISPLVAGESCELHNQTMTLSVIQEDGA